MSPPQVGHASGNSSPTLAISLAQAIRDLSWETLTRMGVYTYWNAGGKFNGQRARTAPLLRRRTLTKTKLTVGKNVGFDVSHQGRQASGRGFRAPPPDTVVPHDRKTCFS